ncbi:ADP-ribosylglycohydrolase [Halanaerobium saccharolyticum]|uniref:ADP-ribosylglycohydrolase n=1 Tax=Halanaerobium saccharolyticum TaxID=43595 RepID=A0A4R7YMG0_9FIRM|nr:ADP-ribosylglycohydrolase family protein [Halanaerobium saccharolyticum]RAK04121.1 ADP-ribosylglycohydrolase [Halanaerobium saccharolyticum]TDV97895.1 ADP-ribosylglycohydrolase [Halanaerobium saccharolyticum]TDX50998.1 ADP-ribosylglycohydrolase [Halanaerobium saccharolyticum]
MKNKRKDLIKVVFVADALSFGSHWVYSTDQLKEEYSGIIDEYRAPMAKFHQGKEAGDLSHYGEQAFALLKSISEHQGFYLKRFKDDWIEYLENNEMYMDHSMKDSLEKLKGSDTLTGADNVELGGIARSLPVFIEEGISKKEFLDLVHLTHNGEIVDQTAEYIFNVIQDTLEGSDYKKALETHKDINQFIKDNFEKIGSKDKIVENADQRGQSCSTEKGLPIVLDVLWNADNLLEALTLNIMSAGDTSSRSMVIAAIMSADEGLDSIPQKLLDGFNKSQAVKELLS